MTENESFSIITKLKVLNYTNICITHVLGDYLRLMGKLATDWACPSSVLFCFNISGLYTICEG